VPPRLVQRVALGPAEAAGPVAAAATPGAGWGRWRPALAVCGGRAVRKCRTVRIWVGRRLAVTV